MDKLADVLKLFLEKYFVQTLASIAISILIVAKKPNISQISEKTNEFMYFILVFCSVMIIVLSIYKVYKTICSKIGYLKTEKQYQKYVETENPKVLETLWTFVDKLSIPEKKVLFGFLRTNNTPIKSSAIYLGDSIFNNSNIMYETTVGTAQEEPHHSIPNQRNQRLSYVPIEQAIMSIPVKGYKLKDDFFPY